MPGIQNALGRGAGTEEEKGEAEEKQEESEESHRERFWWIERVLLKRGQPLRVKGCQGLRLGKKVEA
jgi:hypothetical protein